MKKYLILFGLLFGLFVYMGFQQNSIERLKQERERYRANTNVLLSDVEQYKVRDSLNVARVGALELTLKEYKQHRAEDVELINSLRSKIKNLQNITSAQTETIIELQATPADTIVIRDSVRVKAQNIVVNDKWYDFYATLENDRFTARLFSRDSLLLTEYITYKRFLGFLWKTGKVKDKQFDILSKNPNTKITGFEYIEIKK